MDEKRIPSGQKTAGQDAFVMAMPHNARLTALCGVALYFPKRAYAPVSLASFSNTENAWRRLRTPAMRI